MSKSKKVKGVVLLLVLAFVFITLLDSVNVLAFAADEVSTETFNRYADVSVANIPIEKLDIPIFKYIGAPINQVKTSKVGAIYNQNEGFYYILASIGGTSISSKLAVINSITGKTLKIFDLPGASGGVQSMIVGQDGNMYIGIYAATSDENKLYRYNPNSNELEDLGCPSPGERVVYTLINGPNGIIYGGTYPGGKLFSYDIKTNKFADLGQVLEGAQYVRGLAYDKDDNVLFIGVGTPFKLIKYNIVTEEKTSLMDSSFDIEGYPNYLSIVGDRIFVVGNKSRRLLVFDKDTMEQKADLDPTPRGFAISPDNDALYFNNAAYVNPITGEKEPSMFKYDVVTDEITQLYIDPSYAKYGYWSFNPEGVKLNEPSYPGYSMIGIISMTKLYKFNIQTKKAELIETDIPPQPQNIYFIGKGSDGRIYASGSQGNTGIYSPETNELKSFSGMSQIEGIASLNGKTYFGIYPNARIVEYDPMKGELNEPGTWNEILKFDTEQLQDRPQAMVGVDEYGKLFIGSVPYYGQRQGAFTTFDPVTKEVEYHRGIVENQSIISMAYKDGKIFGGTSILGAYGTEPVEKEGKVFIWDIEKKQKIKELVPVPGKQSVSGLTIGPDGNVWGCAQGYLFIMNAETYDVIYTDRIIPAEYSGPTWAEARLEMAPNSDVYGCGKGYFFRIENKTKKCTILNHDMDFDKLAMDIHGNVYMKSGNTPYAMWEYIPNAPVREEALLKSINIVNGQLTTAFSPTILNYEAVVSELPLEIKVEAQDPHAQIIITQPKNFDDSCGANTAIITVMASDNKYAETYTIDVKRIEEPPAPPEPSTPPSDIQPVDDVMVDQAIEQAEDSQQVAINGSSNKTVVALTPDQLQKIADTGKSLAVVVRGVKFVLPLEVLVDMVDTVAAQIEFKTQLLAQQEAKQIMGQVSDSSGLRMTQAFEFKIEAVASDGTRQEIDSFTNNINNIIVSIPIPESVKQLALLGRLAVYNYDESDKTFEMVGGSYDRQTNTITFQTEHLSKYALLEQSLLRLDGTDRFETSVEAARQYYPKTDTAILAANANDFADGLAASILAGAIKAPVLLTQGDQLPQAVSDYLEEAGVKKVYIIGGPSVITTAVEESLSEYEIERIYGDNRENTAVEIAREVKTLGKPLGDMAIIVNGYAPADALVAGPLAAQGMPLMMVNTNDIPQVTKDALKALGIKDIIVVGGTYVVSDEVFTQLKGLVSGSVERYGEIDRIATSIALAEKIELPNVVVVGYDGLPDAVAGGYVGYLEDGAVIYTQTDGSDDATMEYIKNKMDRDTRVTILGGNGVVSDGIKDGLAEMLK